MANVAHRGWRLTLLCCSSFPSQKKAKTNDVTHRAAPRDRIVDRNRQISSRWDQRRLFARKAANPSAPALMGRPRPFRPFSLSRKDHHRLTSLEISPLFPSSLHPHPHPLRPVIYLPTAVGNTYIHTYRDLHLQQRGTFLGLGNPPNYLPMQRITDPKGPETADMQSPNGPNPLSKTA